MPEMDMMYLGISNYSEYSRRISTMNFRMNEYITLKTDTVKFTPVLSSLENTYGLSKALNINVVFSPGENHKDVVNSETLDFILSDDIFNTGISHFVFRREAIEQIPEFTYFIESR